jgi:hypothetical protein
MNSEILSLKRRDVISEIEQRIHTALEKHKLERIEHGYRLVYPGGAGVATLRLLPVEGAGEGPRVLAIAEITAEYLAPGMYLFHPTGVQRLNALAVHGAYYLRGETLLQKAQFSIYSNEIATDYVIYAILTAFGAQLPLGQSIALATGSTAVLEQQRAHHAMPLKWKTPLPDGALKAAMTSLQGRGLAASHNEKAVWGEIPLSGTIPSRSIDPSAETALIQVNVDTVHPIAGCGYIASLSLPWPKEPADPAGICRRLNELEFEQADFVPRLGAWGLHGTRDQPMYTCCIPCADPYADLHMTLVWWTAMRAAWIRDRYWVAGQGIDFDRVPVVT